MQNGLLWEHSVEDQWGGGGGGEGEAATENLII